jgi:hypothetical protein
MWSAPLDLYCERTDPSFWAEPANALSNVAFLIAAFFAYRDWRKGGDVATLLLIAVTLLVGLGSFAFHTLATRGAVLLDTIPIALFIHGYLYLALRRFIGLRIVLSLLIVAAFFGASHGLTEVLPGRLLNGSVGYLPALFALLVVGWLANGATTRRALFAAAAVFAVSLAFRTVDLWLCSRVPLGTHAVWHMLNGAVLYLLLRAAISAPPLDPRSGRGRWEPTAGPIR